MATTLESLTQLLNKKGIPHEVDQEFIDLTANTKSNGHQPIMLRLTGKGELLEFHATPLCQIKDHIYKGVVLQTMSIIAWQYPCLKMSYHPERGTVGASIEIPLLDMELTETTFWYCLNQLVTWLDEFMPRLQSVLATGTDPARNLHGISY